MIIKFYNPWDGASPLTEKCISAREIRDWAKDPEVQRIHGEHIRTIGNFPLPKSRLSRGDKDTVIDQIRIQPINPLGGSYSVGYYSGGKTVEIGLFAMRDDKLVDLFGIAYGGWNPNPVMGYPRGC